MKKYIVTLDCDERNGLVALTSKGMHKSQKILNAITVYEKIKRKKGKQSRLVPCQASNVV